ncbi:glycosyltransferase [Gluconobacter thailandicus]|uniref:Uncharacterized protein n=1 Tax=Gluconobacter thailandicus TaxID=257438 RepID=A0AAP9JHB6_GLUTH|nr:glycosyltransferase [Gluconobacter thailandicus]QEH96137.1 hypothetical protein FXF46_07485 [Gluconobacter thailandicus]
MKKTPSTSFQRLKIAGIKQTGNCFKFGYLVLQNKARTTLRMKIHHKIKHLHHVLILDEEVPLGTIPQSIKRNLEAAQYAYPLAEQTLWRNQEIRNLIKEHFDDDVLYSYDILAPYSYKADLAKFVILYVFGGLYIDLGVQIAREWNIPNEKGIAACRDVSFTSPSWSAIQTGLLWSLPKRREFEIAIQYIVENCKSKYYGENPLYPTGPVVLGRAFIAALAEKGQDATADDQYVGSCRSVTPDSPMLNVSYVSKGGEVIAFRNKLIGGDLLHLGVTGSNNYNKIWEERAVYGEKIREWNSNDCLIRTDFPVFKNEFGITAPADFDGILSYGPYTSLNAGAYKLRIELEPGTTFRKIEVDITAEFQRELIKSYVFFPTDISNDDSITMLIEVNKPKEKVEFVIRTETGFQGTIKKFELEPILFQKWLFSDPAIKTEIGFIKDGGISTRPWTKGRLTYGPYASLQKGCYKLRTKFSPETRFTNAVIQIAAGKEHKTRQTLKLKPIDMKRGCIETFFTLDQNEENVEFRLCVNRLFMGKFLSYEILSQ